MASTLLYSKLTNRILVGPFIAVTATTLKFSTPFYNQDPQMYI